MSRLPQEPNEPRPNSEEDESSSIRLPSLPRRLPALERIMTETIHLPGPAAFRGRAQFTFFCGGNPERMAGYDGQLEMVGRCLEWFVFDYYIPALEATPAQYWFAQNRDKLSPDEQQTIEQCLYFILGLFEVIEVNPGKMMVVEDLLRPNNRAKKPLETAVKTRNTKTAGLKRGRQYIIQEQVLTSEVKPGQMLLARLFPYQNHYILSGMAAVMNPNATKQIKDLIRQKKLVPEYILKDLDGVELENLFGRNVTDIERGEDPELAHQILKRYVEEICPTTIKFGELLQEIRTASDPFGVTATLCDGAKIFCRHEMDLVLACVMSLWYYYHQQDDVQAGEVM